VLGQKYFKYSLWQCYKDVEIHKANGLAAALQADKTDKTFWQLKSTTKPEISITTSIGGWSKWWFRDC